jgi:hypothetical protein
MKQYNYYLSSNRFTSLLSRLLLTDTVGVCDRMGSEWILGGIGLGGVDWIRLTQDKDRWRAVVSAVMNFRVLAPRS